MKTFLKISLAVFASIILSLSVFADNNDTQNIYARSVLCGSTESFDGFALPSDASFLTEESVKPETTGARITSFTSHGDDTFLRIFMEQNATRLDMKYSLLDENDEGKLLSGSIAFGVYPISSSQKAHDALIPFEITIKSDEGEYFCRVNVPFATPSIIYTDTSYIPSDARITEITLSMLKHDDFGEIVNVITTHPAETKDVSFDFQKSGGLMWMSFLKGTSKITDTEMVLGTDTDNVSFQAVPEGEGDFDSSTLYRAYCSVGCSNGNGVVSISTVESNSSSAQQSISPERGYTLVRFSHNKGNEITFDFKSGSQNAVTLNHLKFHPTTEVDSFASSSVTGITYSDGKLFVEGKLSGNLVSTYPKESLGLYKLSPATGKSELIHKVDITSRFSFTVDLKNQPHVGVDNLFYVSVISSNGDELLRVSDPKFISSGSTKVPAASDFGLYGANPISVYESGASHIMLDVDLAKLITSKASNTTISRGKYVFGINTDYLKELDSDMSFYRSAGVSVYVRLTCQNYIISSVDGSWLTYHGTGIKEVMLRTDHPEALNMYMATVSFLCQRYPNIASFIISSGANSESLTGIPTEDEYAYASEIAMVARLVYNAASELSRGITVTVPIDLEGGSISADIFTALLAERFTSIGAIPWSVMYYSDSESPSIPAENILSSIRTNGTAGPSYTTVLWSADGSSADPVKAYKDFCTDCSITSVKLVFLSVDNSSEVSRDDFNRLKNEMQSGSAILMDSTPITFKDTYYENIKGTFTLWDFESSYSPEGWSAGYGISSLMSSAESMSPGDGKRVLRCITEGSADSPAGIILCSPEYPLNLSASPLVEFVFSCDAAEDTQIIFVFANGTSRAEFSFTNSEEYLFDGKYRAVCDLSEFADSSSIGYAGVIIYSETPVTFEISRINALSHTANEGEIKERIFATANNEDSEKAPPIKEVALVLGSIVVIMISFKITSSLKKRDAEHTEKTRALKASKRRRI